ncbi:glycosyltransferase family 2 protein [Stenotrophomonas sp. ZAC14D1_NAIMI4_6]|uniref:glycosyltransferase family 2 protein n=1 Tax=Stenotrophomonas maltophilia group TaxID=995085 RepID=UPI0009A1B5CE|nr:MULTISPECIES: glycosyltransferase family 2 protein [Stenotrophomonas maltophilia group]AWH35756.1 glycosyltransferase family 2 protein [Stenotrophomonas sp. ZAC14D1_NAIMI4_6]AWH39946.1 glycosyltransferase family 2 protein [Stenotrophomonas sp. ZAC14D1_NAIMI4_1]
MTRPRILHCITVYNGRAFVPAAIESAIRMDQTHAQIDVLVLDDASPEPGWSEELAAFCRERDVMYYRTPRNLGIPRNVSLGMLTAVKRGYDYVVISNSDVLYPRDLMGQMLEVSRQPGVGSVTAWSNNVSIYSLPNEDPNRFLHDQGVVDWVHAGLAGHFGDAAMDIPAGISFCILISTDVVREVGIMDPCFGRGYCEETDWSLRSLAAGYRIVLAPGTYVFHHGRGSNLDAGIVSLNATTVPANEAIIDLRYPLFRRQVDAFVQSGVLARAHEDAIRKLVVSAGQQFGYGIDVGWVARDRTDESQVIVQFSPDAAQGDVVASFRGFRLPMKLASGDLGAQVRAVFGTEPSVLNLFDRGGVAESLSAEFASVARPGFGNYPATI